jgi:hypothetical protein
LKQTVSELETILAETDSSVCDPKGILILLEMTYREVSGKEAAEVKDAYTKEDIADKLALIKSALENPLAGYDLEKAFIPLETARRKLTAVG